MVKDPTERFRLDKAFRAYAANRTEEGFDAFLNEFADCIREGRHAMVPAEYASGALQYSLFRGPGGWYYGICTSPEELDLLPEAVPVIALLGVMAKRAGEDEELKGICVNPGNRDRVYIPREYFEL